MKILKRVKNLLKKVKLADIEITNIVLGTPTSPARDTLSNASIYLIKAKDELEIAIKQLAKILDE